MASKRSSLDGRKALWKEHMSRVVTRVRRSSSNSPIEEITMSTTRSKSSEVEFMGDNEKSTLGGKIECISSQIYSRGGRKEGSREVNVSFLMSLTQEKNYAQDLCFIF